MEAIIEHGSVTNLYYSKLPTSSRLLLEIEKIITNEIQENYLYLTLVWEYQTRFTHLK